MFQINKEHVKERLNKEVRGVQTLVQLIFGLAIAESK